MARAVPVLGKSTDPVLAPVRNRVVGCGDKIAYRSRRHAMNAAQNLLHNTGLAISETYCCTHCGRWHLSTRGKIKPQAAHA